jgi:hypothetical protein
MRTKILLLVGLLSLGISGFAQSDIRFGITANPSLVWVKPDNTQISGDGVRFGFNFGLVVDYVFGNDERYSINSGLSIMLAGAKIMSTDTALNQVHELTAKVNYLELPVSIKLRSNEVGYLTFYGQLGLTPQFAVRSRADYTQKEESGTVITDINNIKLRDIPFYPNNIDKVRPFNLGLLVEAGMEYDITENTVLVGGLYFNAGFLDMFKDNDGERIVARNMGLRVSVLF